MSEQETRGTESVETTETTRVVETAQTQQAESGTTPAGSAADLGKVRDLVLKAHPDVVPDLVRGSSVDELIASVEPARSAYQQVADAVRGGGSEATTEATGTAEPIVATPPVVPAGGGVNVVDPGSLSPQTKIARALAERRRK